MSHLRIVQPGEGALRRRMTSRELRTSADALIELHGGANALRLAHLLIKLVPGDRGLLNGLREVGLDLRTLADHPDLGALDSLAIADFADEVEAIAQEMTARPV